MTDSTVQSISIPTIRRLTIQRFRGIEYLRWYPKPGLNLILGGGDVGKTTILEAIALLISPTNNMMVGEADYWHREVEGCFSIEAVMSLPERSGVNHQRKQAFPWGWDGCELKLPSVENDPTIAVMDPVYCVRVCGTADFDLSFEIVQPDESIDHFSVSIRRSIGLVRLSGDDRNDRDLRLVQGSALDRLISDKTLRSRLGKKLGEVNIEQELKQDAQSRLGILEKAFGEYGLPTGLHLGMTGGQGLSLNALIGLTGSQDGVQLPLASWGAGTRRWAALQIAAAQQGENPIVLVDEAERGLEPYRQRLLVSELQANRSQGFVTTHSVTVLDAAPNAALWYLDAKGKIGALPTRPAVGWKVEAEAFLARLAIIAEGQTEIGFVRYVLERELDANLSDYGIFIADGHGNDSTLSLLEALVQSGLTFGGFADNEARDETRWTRVKQRLGDLLFRWSSGCLEENIIKLVPPDRLEEFITDDDGDSGFRLRTLADRLGTGGDKAFSTICAKAKNLPQLIIDAATGAIPAEMKDAEKSQTKAWKKHSQCWFKSIAGGVELGRKIYDFGLWPQLKTEMMPFLNAVGSTVGLFRDKATHA
jgi:putative ATP-dependent endonuclease of OLD family